MAVGLSAASLKLEKYKSETICHKRYHEFQIKFTDLTYMIYSKYRFA